MENPNASQIKAGQIAARVMTEIADDIKGGVKTISICTKVEKLIIDLGGRPAFPCNVSIDNVASHYTSPPNDSSTIPADGIVKVDLGVQIDGYLSDMAKTFVLDEGLEALAIATDDALSEAIAAFQPGVRLGEIGATIERVIKTYGLKPIKNLTGHNMTRFRLHAGKKVPNVKTRTSDEIKVGECYAIEPFATSGVGSVVDSDLIYIFANTGKVVEFTGNTEKLRLHLRKKYGPLPFTLRWIGTKSKDIDLVEEIKNLMKEKIVRGYPVQVSKKARPVSQSEHTVFVTEKGPRVLTKLN